MRFCRIHRTFTIAGVLALTLLGRAWASGAGSAHVQVAPTVTGTSARIALPGALSAIDPASCSLAVQADSLADGRREAVESFLEKHSCEISDLAHDFVLAAELNKIDYRLLPVLAVLETGCGRASRNHNLFGWANGRKPFASFRQSIHFVAQRLRIAPHYYGKTVAQKLKVYNRRIAYQRKVLRMMDTMPEPGSDLLVAEDSPDAGGLE